MRKLAVLLCVLWVAGALATAQDKPREPVPPTTLLDRMTGDWVLQGVIGRKQTTHDVHAAWILNHEYIQFHEVSREKNDDGSPAYEAIVYLYFDPKAQEYTCLWLDNTAGGGLKAETIAHGKPAPDTIPVVFTLSPTEGIHTTFRYDREKDAWQWLIDNVVEGKTTRFADVKLTKKQ